MRNDSRTFPSDELFQENRTDCPYGCCRNSKEHHAALSNHQHESDYSNEHQQKNDRIAVAVLPCVEPRLARQTTGVALCVISCNAHFAVKMLFVALSPQADGLSISLAN